MYFDWEKWDLLPRIPQNLLVGFAIKTIALLPDAYPIFWPSFVSIQTCRNLKGALESLYIKYGEDRLRTMGDMMS